MTFHQEMRTSEIRVILRRMGFVVIRCKTTAHNLAYDVHIKHDDRWYLIPPNAKELGESLREYQRAVDDYLHSLIS